MLLMIKKLDPHVDVLLKLQEITKTLVGFNLISQQPTSKL